MSTVISCKKILAELMYYSGLVKIIRGRFAQGGIILAYHRILPKDSIKTEKVQSGLYVTTEVFEEHIKYISKNYNVISLSDIGTSLETMPMSSCIITFDDGWADNYHHAYPILMKYGITATVFIATNMIGTNEWLWTDRICHYIEQKEFPEIIDSCLSSLGIKNILRNLSNNKKEINVEKTIEYIKRFEQSTIMYIMSKLDQAFSLQYIDLKARSPWLSWEQVFEMSQNGISFGAHTHNHIILTSVPLNIAEKEIKLSREILIQKINKPINTFCYPNGIYNKEIIDLVKNSGFTIAVTTKKGVINESRSFLELRRIMIHNDMTNTLPMFASIITGKLPLF